MGDHPTEATVSSGSSVPPLVSVITTVFNTERYLPEALESVLGQRFSDYEYIVVDDCSTDQSYDIAERYAAIHPRIRLFRNKANLGDYPNRKRSAELARGKYIKYVDSDNVLYPHALEVYVDSMERFPEAGLGLCKVNDVTKPLPDVLSSEEAYFQHFFGGGFFTNAPTSAIVRRSAYESVGGFRDIRHRGDLDLWLRVAARFGVVRVPAFLDWDRMRDGQESQKNGYLKRKITYDVSMGALLSSACPLSSVGREQAIKKYRATYAVSTLRATLKGEVSISEAVAEVTQRRVALMAALKWKAKAWIARSWL